MSAPRGGQVLSPKEPWAPQQSDNFGADKFANRAEFVIDQKTHGLLIALAQEAAERGSPDPYEGPSEPPVIRRWPPKSESSERLGRIRTADGRLGLEGIPEKPCAKINRSAGEGWRGRTYSFKAKDLVPWNGRLVSAAILDADADGEVTALMASPITLEFSTAQGPRVRSPHLLVCRNGSSWLLDCYWERTAGRPERADLWNDLGRACASLGLGYEVLTERHLLSGVRARNVAAIGRARCDDPVEAETMERVLDRVGSSGMALAELVDDQAITDRVLYRLILDGYLKVDLETPLVRATAFGGERARLCA